MKFTPVYRRNTLVPIPSKPAIWKISEHARGKPKMKRIYQVICARHPVLDTIEADEVTISIAGALIFYRVTPTPPNTVSNRDEDAISPYDKDVIIKAYAPGRWAEFTEIVSPDQV